ncbi:unnamed protein product, partial [Allacma fusca]
LSIIIYCNSYLISSLQMEKAPRHKISASNVLSQTEFHLWVKLKGVTRNR